MPLERYRAKRDFTRTPEPAPGPARAPEPPSGPPTRPSRHRDRLALPSRPADGPARRSPSLYQADPNRQASGEPPGVRSGWVRPVRRPPPSREPAALRPAPRDRRRPRLVGAPEGTHARPGRAALRCPNRGPPDRVPRLRGRHPDGRVRRRRFDLLGLGHLRAGADVRIQALRCAPASSSSACGARSWPGVSRSSARVGVARPGPEAIVPPGAPAARRRAMRRTRGGTAKPARATPGS